MYVATLLNFTANPSLNWQIPEAVLNGNTTDCSILTQFHFNEPVWYAIDNHFPSESPERPGVFVGFALNKGDQLTFKVVDDETEEILVRSVVRPKDPTRPNNRAAFIPFEGEESSPPADTPGESGDPKTFVRQAEAEGEGSNSKKGKPKAQAKKNNDNLSAAEKAKLGLGKLSPDEMLGRSVLLPEAEDGTRHRAQIVQKIVEHDDELNKEIIKF